MPGTSRFEVLRERDYRRLFLGRTTSLIGDGMAPVALAFAILDLTGSATDLGIVIAVHSLVLIALILVGGSSPTGSRRDGRCSAPTSPAPSRWG